MSCLFLYVAANAQGARQLCRRAPAFAGVRRRSPAQKIAKSAIGFLAGGGQISRPLFETIVDQNLGGHGPLSPLKIFFLVSSRGLLRVG